MSIRNLMLKKRCCGQEKEEGVMVVKNKSDETKEESNVLENLKKNHEKINCSHRLRSCGSFSFGQVTKGWDKERETKKTITDTTYTIEMKNNYQHELAEAMKNWSPDRINAFHRVFVYGSGRGFEPISKDTLYHYYPYLDKH